MNATNKPARLTFLDVVSGVMLLSVVLLHVAVLTHDSDLEMLCRQILSIAVPWFFFKAGLFVSRKRSVKEWLKNDAYRLLVPFAAWAVIGWLCMLPTYLTADHFSWGNVFAGPVGCLQGKGVRENWALWFLMSLFFVRLMYRLLPANKEWLWMFLALCVGWVLHRDGVLLPLFLSTVFPGLLMLLAGVKCKPLITINASQKQRSSKLMGGVNY